MPAGRAWITYDFANYERSLAAYRAEILREIDRIVEDWAEEVGEWIEGAAGGRVMGRRMVRWALGCGDEESEGRSGRLAHWEARLG